MSVTRGEFLKSLGKAMPGMVLGTGAVAAQKLFSKIAAASGEPVMTPLPEPQTYPKPTPMEIIQCSPSGRPQIALTFDDGPMPGVTDRILDELKQRGAHATFFMIGQNIAKAPDLARRVAAEGHDIGNHSYTHPKLTELPPKSVEEEIQKTQDVIREVIGIQPAWFRAPYLAFRDNLAPLVTQRGMRIVHANVDPSDWSKPGEEKIIEAIARDAKPGAIVLCHDFSEQTSNAIGRVLDNLIAARLQPVSLTTLLAG